MQPKASADTDGPTQITGWDYITILRRQYRIILLSLALFLVAAVAAHFIIPQKFETRVVTVPATVQKGSPAGAVDALASLGLLSGSETAGPKELAVATLNARSFITTFIHDENLLPVLFADEWDAGQKRWKDRPPTDEEAFDRLHDNMAVDSSPTDNLVIVRVRWTDSPTAVRIANRLVQTVNKLFQTKAVKENDRTIAYLNDAYKNEQVSEIRTAIANMIDDQLGQRILALSKVEYELTVVDPALPTKKHITPGLTVLLPLGIFLGLIFGIPGAFLMHRFNPPLRGPLARLLAPRA